MWFLLIQSVLTVYTQFFVSKLNSNLKSDQIWVIWKSESDPSNVDDSVNRSSPGIP